MTPKFLVELGETLTRVEATDGRGTPLSLDHGVARAVDVVRAQTAAVLMAISSSGQSENILRGVEAARAAGCRLVTLSGFRPDNPLRRLGELNFFVPSDSYGYVEITHLALCHGIVDTIIAGSAESPGGR